jgi:hypothetical protein|tara:strand:+ start:582 stop:1385 length:804 start_codon:yes stop_codon:yes gene_type:complete
LYPNPEKSTSDVRTLSVILDRHAIKPENGWMASLCWLPWGVATFFDLDEYVPEPLRGTLGVDGTYRKLWRHFLYLLIGVVILGLSQLIFFASTSREIGIIEFMEVGAIVALISYLIACLRWRQRGWPRHDFSRCRISICLERFEVKERYFYPASIVPYANLERIVFGPGHFLRFAHGSSHVIVRFRNETVGLLRRALVENSSETGVLVTDGKKIEWLLLFFAFLGTRMFATQQNLRMNSYLQASMTMIVVACAGLGLVLAVREAFLP